MVPMFMCGLVRSNFALAIGVSPELILLGYCYGMTPYGPRETSGNFTGVRCPPQNGVLLPAGLLDDFLGHGLGDLGVGIELHRVRRTAGGLGPQVADVAEHL